MRFAVSLSREAVKDLTSLSRSDRRLYGRILRKLESLLDAPRAGKPLVGNHVGEFSLRIGDYQIIYELDSKKKRVFILTARHRRHVY